MMTQPQGFMGLEVTDEKISSDFSGRAFKISLFRIETNGVENVERNFKFFAVLSNRLLVQILTIAGMVMHKDRTNGSNLALLH